jgi:hypothetical protein
VAVVVAVEEAAVAVGAVAVAVAVANNLSDKTNPNCSTNRLTIF